MHKIRYNCIVTYKIEMLYAGITDIMVAYIIHHVLVI